MRFFNAGENFFSISISIHILECSSEMCPFTDIDNSSYKDIVIKLNYSCFTSSYIQGNAQFVQKVTFESLIDFKLNHFEVGNITKAATFISFFQLSYKNTQLLFCDMLFNIFMRQTLIDDFWELHESMNCPFYLSFISEKACFRSKTINIETTQSCITISHARCLWLLFIIFL